MMNTIGPLLILFIGLVVFGCGVFSFLQQYTKIAHALRTDGVVTELIGVRARRQAFVVARTESGVKIEPKTRYRPQIRFTTDSGRAIELVGRVASRPARYKVGERVPVLYNPHNPTEAYLNSFWEIWFVTLMLVFFGLLTMGMGLLGWVLSGL
jgi:hypothetical protein